MATALAVGSMLASGGSAIAGLTGVGAGLTIGGLTLSQVAGGLGIVSQVMSIFSGGDDANAAYDAQIAASRAELDAARTRAAQTDLEAQRAETQAALEDAERQRRLRRTLAAQRAAFAGGSVDPFSGSPVAIQDATAGEINREGRLADIATQDTVASLNAQRTGQLAQGAGRASSLIGQANTSLIASQQNQSQQLTQLAGNATRFIGTLK